MPLAVWVLRNDFVALRHGQSQANRQQIIVSSPEVAIASYGLTDLGKTQARQAGRTICQWYNKHHHQGLCLVCSDFLRAQQTAEIVEQIAVEVSP